MDSQESPWHVAAGDFPHGGDSRQKLTFLLRYAILAPSSHNTQPWQFAVGDDEIHLFADRSRWLQVADADQRELHISLGCALENLLVAAENFGYGQDVVYFPDPANADLVAAVTLTAGGEPSAFRPAGLFEAIPQRHTNHNTYDERPIPPEDQARLEACAIEEGLSLHMTDDPGLKRQVDDMIVEADAQQFADPAWREELGYWLGQGVFGAPWLMSKMSQLAVTYLNLGQGTAKKDSELLMSAPLLAVITSVRDDRPSQIQAGQIFERVSLLATALEIRLHPMSQILEIPEFKAQVARLTPEPDAAPQHTFRLGYAEPEDHTPRRPLQDVLVT